MIIKKTKSVYEIIGNELKYTEIYEVNVLELVFYHSCGNKVSSENASFCHIYGSHTSDSPTNPSNDASIPEQNEPRNTGKVQKSRSNPPILIYISIIIIGLIGLGSFYAYYNWQKSTQNTEIQSPNDGPIIYEAYSGSSEVIP